MSRAAHDTMQTLPVFPRVLPVRQQAERMR